MATQQAIIDGIAAVEKAILQAASAHHLPGLRLEWNEDLDFGHMMDPVPVALVTNDGRLVEEEFSVEELKACAGGDADGVREKVERMVEAAGQQAGGEQKGDSRGF